MRDMLLRSSTYPSVFAVSGLEALGIGGVTLWWESVPLVRGGKTALGGSGNGLSLLCVVGDTAESGVWRASEAYVDGAGGTGLY